MKKNILMLAISVCGLVGLQNALAADPYPTKPIRFISQFPAGGGTDILARLVGPKLTELTGQPVIVENRAGAAGNIGADYVAKSPADGYTILVANNVIVTNPAIQKTPFNVEKDFAPITVFGAQPIVLAVHPTVGSNNLTELVAFLKRNPAKFAFSSCGSGTAQHLAGELFKEKAGVDIVHAAYKGCAPAIVDGLSGEVPIVFNTLANVLPYTKDGKLKILAIASTKKSAVDPKIQTMEEAGLKGFDAEIWYGFLAPAGTPRDVVSKLNDAFKKIILMPDVQEKLKGLAFNIQASTPEEFSGLIRSDVAKWSKLVKDARIEFTP